MVQPYMVTFLPVISDVPKQREPVGSLCTQAIKLPDQSIMIPEEFLLDSTLYHIALYCY